VALLAAPAFGQAIMGTAGDGALAVVFPTPASGLPTPAQVNVSGLPAGAWPHGVSYYGSDRALVSDFGNSRIFVVQVSTATALATIDTSGAGYLGYGTIAVAPGLSHALACGASSTLFVVHAPFAAGSTITSVALPGSIAGYQTQAIVFNPQGRAFVYHTAGISVLDPPYAAIAFTIPVAGNTNSGAVAVTPDGSQLLVTTFGSTIDIFTTPYSAGSTPATLTVAGALGLDGLMVTPDGARALVADAFAAGVYSVAAPFTPASTVESIPLPAAITTTGLGFEDVGIAADGLLAVVTGNSVGNAAPAAFIQAPFTTAGATVHAVTVNGPGRGAGAVRFLPPGLAPGLTVSKSAPATVASGAQLTYTITYGNTGTAAATNVVIQDTVPAGTTFVSATAGGVHAGGVVTWNLGTVNAGVTNQTVQFTVAVNAGQGASVVNDTFSIAADEVSPIFGPPVTTAVTAQQVTPVPTVSEAGLVVLGLLIAALGAGLLVRRGAVA